VSLADAAVPAEVLEAHRPPAEVPAVYDRLARIYEVWARLTESRARRRVMALARPAAGERVLEVACGTGVQLAALARANPGGETIGVDLSRAMLAQARARAGQLPGVAVREADDKVYTLRRDLPLAGELLSGYLGSSRSSSRNP